MQPLKLTVHVYKEFVGTCKSNLYVSFFRMCVRQAEPRIGQQLVRRLGTAVRSDALHPMRVSYGKQSGRFKRTL